MTRGKYSRRRQQQLRPPRRAIDDAWRDLELETEARRFQFHWLSAIPVTLASIILVSLAIIALGLAARIF